MMRALILALGLLAAPAAWADPVTFTAVVVAAAYSAGMVSAVTAALVVTATVYGAYRQRKAAGEARQEYNAAQKDRQTMIRSAVAPRQIILGRDKVSGPIVYVASTGDKKQYLHLVIALAGHPIDAVETIYFNDVALPTPDASGWITSGAFYKAGTPVDKKPETNATLGSTVTLSTTPSSIVSVTMRSTGSSDDPGDLLPASAYTVSGNVVTITSGVAAWYTVNYRALSAGTKLVRIKTYDGTQTAADADLVAETGGEWTSAHIGRGVPYLYARLEYDSEVFGQIGIPNISAVVRGAKVYDPRRNRAPNPGLTGAVPGTPGTLPSGMVVTVPASVGYSVVGSGTDPASGLPYLDVRLSGTSAATSQITINPIFYSVAPAAAPGSAWSARLGVRFLSITGAVSSTVQLQILSYDAANATTVEVSGSTVSMSTAAGLQWATVTDPALGASAAKVGFRLRLSTVAGATYDTTVRLLLPQLWPGLMDPTAWSDNAALCAAWWFAHPTLGGRAAWDEVPDAEVSAEANVCDETVVINAGGTTQKRYTCNGTLDTSGALRDNMEAILSGMAGYACWSSGRWLLRAGAYESPSMTIDEYSLAQGDITISPRTPRRELINAVTGRYLDASSAYIERQHPVVDNPVYLAADGGLEYAHEMDHPMVRDAMRAQRMAKITLELARQSMAVELTCNLRAYDAVPGRTVYLTLSAFGITAKPMLVAERTYLPAERRIRLRLVEVSAASFAWTYGNATWVDTAPNSTLPTNVGRHAAPTNVVAVPAASVQTDSPGVKLPQADVSWDAPTDPGVLASGRTVVQMRRDNREAWLDAGVFPAAVNSATVGPLDAAAPTLVRVAFVGPRGMSDWTVVPVAGSGVGKGVNVSMGTVSVVDITSGGTNAAAAINLNANGTVTGSRIGSFRWYLGGTPSGYSARATLLSGSSPAGPVAHGTWVALGVNRAWSLPENVVGTLQGSLLLEIAATADTSTVLGTVTVNFTSTKGT